MLCLAELIGNDTVSSPRHGAKVDCLIRDAMV